MGTVGISVVVHGDTAVINGEEFIRLSSVPDHATSQNDGTKQIFKSASLKDAMIMWGVKSSGRVSKIVRQLNEMGFQVGQKFGKSWSLDPDKLKGLFQDGTVEKVVDYLKEKEEWR